MDNTWTYGSEPQNIYADIVEGRPNGMPSFRGKIPDQQVWEIVAFVRSMSGQLSKDVAPGRSDEMQGGKPPSSTPREQSHGPEGVHPK
jgi:cytochrome c oxidase cbb3-type subunit 3